ncbi:MAG: ABC transporter permease subunit [Acidimicrobiia bacterium]|nr:ABC transporter permease subunit [Acidimicrobiia bacterium]
MMMRLLRTELYKQLRLPRTWVALAVVVAIPIIITVALKVSPPDTGPGRGGGERGDGLFRLATQSGLLIPAAALRVMSEFFLVVIICMFAGDAVASEAGWGNLRFLLTRPISRARLLTTKLIVAAVYGLGATAMIVVAGLIAGVLAFGFHPVTLPIVGINESTGSLLGHLGLAVLLAAWGIAGVAAFAFMLSTMMDNSAGAIFGAVGFYIVTSILGAISSIGPMRYGFPTFYGGAWSQLFQGASFGGDMWRNLLVQIPYVLVFAGIGFWWFRRKDITS